MKAYTHRYLLAWAFTFALCACFLLPVTVFAEDEALPETPSVPAAAAGEIPSDPIAPQPVPVLSELVSDAASESEIVLEAADIEVMAAEPNAELTDTVEEIASSQIQLSFAENEPLDMASTESAEALAAGDPSGSSGRSCMFRCRHPAAVRLEPH